MKNLSLYVHIPFCEVKCGYCDFFSVARGYEDFDLQSQYVDQLIKEIERRSEPFKGQNVHTIFFGGGTPSLLDAALLEKLINTLSYYFKWDEKTEFTLEANPKTVSQEKLQRIRELGANRLSMGVQSFEDRFLKVLGRIHSGDEAKKTISDAYAAGFDKVNFDMIFALPGQSFAEWQRDLETALSFHPQHLSAYHLTIEAGTAFESLYKKGKLLLPPEEDGVKSLEWTRERLAQSGLLPYEISNFAKPGFECLHNQNYWEYGQYIGFGAGAASFLKSEKNFAMRQTNARDLKKYLAGEWVGFSEEIDHDLAMGEYCMLSLRTREGISEEYFKDLFQSDFEKRFKNVLQRHQHAGYLIQEHGRWKLTPEGILFSDTVASDFLPNAS